MQDYEGWNLQQSYPAENSDKYNPELPNKMWPLAL